jgi:hypothetical protein
VKETLITLLTLLTDSIASQRSNARNANVAVSTLLTGVLGFGFAIATTKFKNT